MDEAAYPIEQPLPMPAAMQSRVQEPVPLSNESQLFADDFLIAHRSSLHRRLNRPCKRPDPIMEPDLPWEGQGIVYGCVIELPDGSLRMYYRGNNRGGGMDFSTFKRKHGYGKSPICVAVGTDGLAFERPAIQDAARDGTNIVLDDPIDDFTALQDGAAADPGQRFKLLASKGNWWAGLTPAVSPDGIRWEWGKENAVAYLGDRMSYWHDPVRQRHVAWSRHMQIHKRRVIFHRETEDFNDWSLNPDTSFTRSAGYSGNAPWLAIAPDCLDHPETQIYGGYAFWYRSLYFAYLEMFYVQQQRLDTQLACSRDGLTWTRLCDREVFLPNGEHGAFDAYWSVPTFNPPVVRDGRLLIHYNGRPDPHVTPGFNHVPPGMGGAFGVSELREDGFVSLDATGTEGVVETKPLRLPEQRVALEINCCPFNTRPGFAPMDLKVELLAEDGAHLAAYGLHPTDDPEKVWRRVDLDSTLPDTVRLRFRMTNGRLYAFRFV